MQMYSEEIAEETNYLCMPISFAYVNVLKNL